MTDQTPSVQPAEPTRATGRRRKVIGGVAVLLVVIASIAGVTAINLATAAEEKKASASRSAEASQSAEVSKKAAQAKANADLERSTRELAAAMEKSVADAKAKEQKEMKDAGWTYVSDQLYYVIAPPSSVYCGTIQCAGFSVVSQKPAGCPGGIHLEASFLTNDNVSVGRDSESTAALSQGQQATFKLYDRSGAGQVVDVTSMRCR